MSCSCVRTRCSISWFNLIECFICLLGRPLFLLYLISFVNPSLDCYFFRQRNLLLHFSFFISLVPVALIHWSVFLLSWYFSFSSIFSNNIAFNENCLKISFLYLYIIKWQKITMENKIALKYTKKGYNWQQQTRLTWILGVT